ncbi:hypothetical protein FQA47_023929 [Oryzias melastigma]|uniref:Uncharacterized protein n=1 Tax=Oryzias melastigma TaxID=30732 RepID=A0A834CAK7_ORYME|nr:hypothetical protein FQA47_023929 [Oryzias melastigma]
MVVWVNIGIASSSSLLLHEACLSPFDQRGQKTSADEPAVRLLRARGSSTAEPRSVPLRALPPATLDQCPSPSLSSWKAVADGVSGFEPPPLLRASQRSSRQTEQTSGLPVPRS